MTKILVGNKSDLVNTRAIDYEEAEQLALRHKMRYFETSAISNDNVKAMFNFMMEMTFQKKLDLGYFSQHVQDEQAGSQRSETSSEAFSSSMHSDRTSSLANRT